jgi:hypothetical protein
MGKTIPPRGPGGWWGRSWRSPLHCLPQLFGRPAQDLSPGDDKRPSRRGKRRPLRRRSVRQIVLSGHTGTVAGGAQHPSEARKVSSDPPEIAATPASLSRNVLSAPFEVFDLDPRGSWGVAEGQIDGDFTLDDEPSRRDRLAQTLKEKLRSSEHAQRAPSWWNGSRGGVTQETRGRTSPRRTTARGRTSSGSRALDDRGRDGAGSGRPPTVGGRARP